MILHNKSLGAECAKSSPVNSLVTGGCIAVVYSEADPSASCWHKLQPRSSSSELQLCNLGHKSMHLRKTGVKDNGKRTDKVDSFENRPSVHAGIGKSGSSSNSSQQTLSLFALSDSTNSGQYSLVVGLSERQWNKHRTCAICKTVRGTFGCC